MLRYIFREGFAGFKRAKLSSAISIFTIVITLSLLGVFIKIALNAASVISEIKGRFEIEFFISDTLIDEDIEKMKKEIEKDPFVKSISYISKSEAAKIFEKEFGENIVEILGMNPLPHSLKVKINSEYVQPDSVEAFVNRYAEKEGIIDKKYNVKFLKGVQKNSKMLATIGLGLGVILIFASMSLVSNTTRLAITAKQDSIKTMKLVGATYSYIILPFVIEGCLQGAMAGAISALILFAGSMAVDVYYPTIDNALQIEGYFIYPLLAVTGVLLGLFGSLLSIRRFIKI